MLINVALEVLKVLNDNSFDAFIVGGYSRDYYLGLSSSDVDICTSAKYDDLVNIFGDIDDNKYGSYVLIYKGFSFQITTFRKEGKYLKNRYPRRVYYTKKLINDLKRRDFTINTLCIASDGTFVDLMNARLDINHKVIRLIGSNRILRAIRFACIYNFSIDDKLSRAIYKYRDSLINLSFDRMKGELDKIFSSYNCAYGIDLIRRYGLEEYLHIDLSDVVVIPDLCGIWAQILIDDSYNFNKGDRYKIFRIATCINIPFELYDLYKYGKDVFRAVSMIKNDGMNIDYLYDSLPIKDRDDVAVSFFDICNVVSVSNSMINDIYVDIEHKIIYRKLINDKAILLDYISHNYQYLLGTFFLDFFCFCFV